MSIDKLIKDYDDLVKKHNDLEQEYMKRMEIISKNGYNKNSFYMFADSIATLLSEIKMKELSIKIRETFGI